MGNGFPTGTKRATISDVAALAGVSKGTVSKYLADGDYYVAARTKRRIAAAIVELDFQPNALARALTWRRTQTIGVVVASVLNPFYSELITGIDEVLGEEGYTLIFGTTEGSAEKEAAVVRGMQQRQVDGIILASVKVQDREVRQLVDEGLDVILASRDIKSRSLVDAVVVDNEDGARLAVEHLLAHGHARVAHLAGPQDIYPFELRRRAFQDVLSRAGLDTAAPVVIAGTSQEEGASAVRGLLDQPESPTAIFVANDLLALGVIEECARRGLRVPEDLAIIGFDNIWVGGLHGVQLSSVDGRGRDVGRAAAKRLIKRIARRGAEQELEAQLEVLPTRLIRRHTCGCQPMT